MKPPIQAALLTIEQMEQVLVPPPHGKFWSIGQQFFVDKDGVRQYGWKVIYATDETNYFRQEGSVVTTSAGYAVAADPVEAAQIARDRYTTGLADEAEKRKEFIARKNKAIDFSLDLSALNITLD